MWTVQQPNRDTCPNREKGLPRADLRFAATKKKNNIKLQEEASSYCWRPESGYQLFLQQWFWYQSGGSPSLRCWFWLSVGWLGAWETETTTPIPGSIQPGAGRPHPTHKPHLYALFRFHRMETNACISLCTRKRNYLILVFVLSLILEETFCRSNMNALVLGFMLAIMLLSFVKIRL